MNSAAGKVPAGSHHGHENARSAVRLRSDLLGARDLALFGFECAPHDVHRLIEYQQNRLRLIAATSNPPPRTFSDTAIEDGGL